MDDEPIARRTLEILLAQDPDIELIGACDGTEAMRRIPGDLPDLLLLDVEMPEVDGFTLLERVGIETIPAVVFVTAFDRHALRAFDVAAVDFLLKPFDDARFASAIRRAKAVLAAERPLAAAARPYARRLVVRDSGRIVVIDVGDVDWIGSADYYANLHVRDRSYLIRQTMGQLERTLDPQQFYRTHRSSIVNLARVREILSGRGRSRATVRLDRVALPLSRGRLTELGRRLSGAQGNQRSPTGTAP